MNPEWLFDRLTDERQCGEVHHGFNLPLFEQRRELHFIVEIPFNQKSRRNGFVMAPRQIVIHGRVMPCGKQGPQAMRADKSRPSCHQNPHKRQTPLSLFTTEVRGHREEKPIQY